MSRLGKSTEAEVQAAVEKTYRGKVMSDRVHELLEAKVAAIVSTRELVISLGSGGGVTKGMKFQVLAEPIAVKDPDTDELLGVIEQEKVCVEATGVFGLFSVCSTYKKRRTNCLFPLRIESVDVSKGDRVVQFG